MMSHYIRTILSYLIFFFVRRVFAGIPAWLALASHVEVTGTRASTAWRASQSMAVFPRIQRTESCGTSPSSMQLLQMVVSIYGDIPKIDGLSVYHGKSQSKMDDSGCTLILGNLQMWKRGRVKNYLQHSKHWGLAEVPAFLFICGMFKRGVVVFGPTPEKGICHPNIEVYRYTPNQLMNSGGPSCSSLSCNVWRA